MFEKIFYSAIPTTFQNFYTQNIFQSKIAKPVTICSINQHLLLNKKEVAAATSVIKLLPPIVQKANTASASSIMGIILIQT
ncbi:hypothetical protein COJ85_01940 [Bacillus sp. AFS076308]|nr:hypothetical protein COJ85_01940 [Bacillus sp. AFS076308]PGV50369.1 hypothetical protein COD92_18525 [Bacillus sp. AFS037270]